MYFLHSIFNDILKNYNYWIILIKRKRFMEEKCNNIFAAISPSPTYGLVGRKEGDNGMFITQVPKVLITFFFIRWPNNFRTFNEFLSVDALSWVFKFQSTEGLILCVIIGGCTSIYRPLSYPLRSLTGRPWHDEYHFLKEISATCRHLVKKNWTSLHMKSY